MIIKDAKCKELLQYFVTMKRLSYYLALSACLLTLHVRSQQVKGWEMYGLPFRSVEGLKFRAAGGVEKVDAPVARRGWFDVSGS